MTDFMRWLYAHYIKPEIEDSDPTGYETPLSIMDTTLEADQHRQYERVLEFYASRAFCLGFRTGPGLAPILSQQDKTLVTGQPVG